jgi:SAM-dependent methyltransferase
MRRDEYEWKPAQFFPEGWCSECKTVEDYFDTIYKDKRWEPYGERERITIPRDNPDYEYWTIRGLDRLGISGVGSNPKYCIWWIEVVQSLVDQLPKGSTILDIGCGDWELMKFVDWTGYNYIGYDVSGLQVDRVTELYSAPNVKFVQGDACEVELPKANLVLMKDVIQHLQNASISRLMYTALDPSKHDRIIVCYKGLWFEDGATNMDLSEPGRYREVDLGMPPWNFESHKIATGYCGYDQVTGKDAPSCVWEIILKDW